MSTGSRQLPVLATSQLVLLPAMRCWVQLANARARRAVESALAADDKVVALFAARQASRRTETDELYAIGTLARVMNFGQRSCCGRWIVDLEGVERIRVTDWVRLDPFREAICQPLPEQLGDASASAIASAIRALARRLHEAAPNCAHARHAVARLTEHAAPEDVPGAVGALLTHLSLDARQELLEADSLVARLEMTIAALHARLLQSDHSAGRPSRQ